jgi:probable blue pigment (indigoidine) exporter
MRAARPQHGVRSAPTAAGRRRLQEGRPAHSFSQPVPVIVTPRRQRFPHGGVVRQTTAPKPAAVLSSFTGPLFQAGNILPRVQVTVQPPASIRDVSRQLGPVLAAAMMFSAADISGKAALTSGTDVPSLLSFRSILGIGLVFAWLRLDKPAAALTQRAKWISIALGAVLTANMFWLFKAIELVPVSIAILTYFIYPLLTGILGAMTGIDRLTATNAAIALVAFFGLTLIIGANPADLAAAGLAAAGGGALCRAAMLLVTRASLKDADPRLVTWYTLWSSTLGFVGLSVLTWNWHWPGGGAGWVAFLSLGVTTTIGLFALYVSAQRIGPFRTALFMNLEPLMTSALGALLLGESLTPLQMAGGATMIAALCIFQMRR